MATPVRRRGEPMAILEILRSRLDRGFGRGVAVGVAAALLLNIAGPAFARVPTSPTQAAGIEAVGPRVARGLPVVRTNKATFGNPAEFGGPVATPIPHEGSLLDEVGQIQYAVPADKIASWKRDSAPLSKLRLAELTLSGSREPRVAEAELAKVITENRNCKEISLLAKRAKAFALHFQGRYREAANYLRDLIKSGAPNSRALIGFMRHSEACAGCHAAHERLGIYQPGKLDPLCGVRSVAKVVTRFGVPYDEQTASAKVRHDGFGSDLKDIAKGIEAFGFQPIVLTGKAEVVSKMPMPVIAHVEHDHFLTVIAASRSGVKYWCVDCGGTRQVSWRQWAAMEPDVFVSAVKPDSEESVWIADAFEPEGSLFASISPANNPFAGLANSATVQWLPFLPDGIICGTRPEGLLCGDCAKGQTCPVATGGPATGDPVNVATGGEEYKPAADLTVYNPTGPSVAWGREYHSLGNPVENGFGTSWTHTYNFVVNEWESTTPGGVEGGGPTTNYHVDLILPNSAHIGFSLPSGTSKPTSSSPGPITLVPNEQGAAYIVKWQYDATAGGDLFEIQGADETVFRTTLAESYPASGQPTSPYVKAGAIYRLARITNKPGNYITLDYEDKTTRSLLVADGSGGSTTRTYTLRNLKTIRDSAGSPLLTLATDSNGNFVSASDRYSRSVYYSVEIFANANVTAAGAPTQVFGLTQASQIVATGTSSPPTRYQYTYALTGNSDGTEQIPTLKTISVPSPTGTGMSTATINYNADGRVTSLVDGNSNTVAIINDPSINRAEIQFKDPSATVVEKRFLDFDAKMNLTQVRDASGTVVSTKSFSGTNPYKATAVTDATSHTWNYSWDQYGHLLTTETPRGITTLATYDYSVFPMGRLVSIQNGTMSGTSFTGTQTSTTYTYYTNGLLNTVNAPIPGEVNTGNHQTTTYSYDSLGNITSIVTPGNNAETAHTTAFNYTTDGSYSQSAAIGQPLTITNSNGEVTHMRYDARANTTSMWDALGNTSTYSFNLANQQTDSYLPVTGNTGTGNARNQQVFLYTGGPTSQTNAYNESGTLVRQTNLSYGAEGELLSRTGSTEEASFTYNAAYRMKTLRDGAGSTHQTTYTYNTKGQVTQIDYPGNTGGTSDRVQFTSYDNVGRLTGRTDGRGITTTYDYTEPDGQLHSVSYSNGASVAMAYDSYGRVTSVTDSSGVGGSSYDDLGNVTSSTRTYTGLPTKTLGYAFYPDGSRQSMTLPGYGASGSYPTQTWSYAYDKAGRYTSMAAVRNTTPSATNVVQVLSTYYGNGWQNTRTTQRWNGSAWVNGEAATYQYNAVGMLTSLSNTALAENQFAYDGVFNMTGFTVSGIPSPATSMNGTVGFQYDGNVNGSSNRDRLTQETSSRFGGYTENNAYDSAGNPTTYRSSSGIAYNGNNQRTGTGYAYDGNGNPTTYRGSTSAFDEENRMLTTALGGTYSYGYRADGLRAWKKEASYQPKTYYLYDQGNIVCELDASGNCTKNNYFAPDGLIARHIGTSLGIYSFDHQGNVVRVNDAGSTDIRFSYNAWGQVNQIIPSYGWGSSFTNHTYNARWGYYRDNNGLYYCQHRYYDPQNGRWVTRDPIGYGGGANVYGYCRSRSVLSTDPEGLQAASAQTSAALAGAMAEVGSAEAAAADASYEVAAGIINDINAAGGASGGCTSPILSAAGKAIASGAAIIAPAVINDPVVNSPTQGTGGCPPCDPAVANYFNDLITGGYTGEGSYGSYKEFIESQMSKRLTSDECDFDFDTMMDWIANKQLSGDIGSVIARRLREIARKKYRECLSGAIL